MEQYRATIKRADDAATLVLTVNSKSLEIRLNDDNPANVKSAFNGLLKELKNGPIVFKLEDTGTDLYNQICQEYITQLNAELKAVYKQLEENDLLTKESIDQQPQ